MKKLTILLCLFLAFAFAEWDVDPDATTFTVDTLTVNKDATIGGDLTVSGFVKPGVVHASIMPMAREIPIWTSGTKNTLSGGFYSNILGWCSFDSLYVDSIAMLITFPADSNLVDSFYLATYQARSSIATSIVEDGTDVNSTGAWSTVLKIYSVAAVVIPTDLIFQMKFKPDAESEANKVYILNVILYGRPK